MLLLLFQQNLQVGEAEVVVQSSVSARPRIYDRFYPQSKVETREISGVGEIGVSGYAVIYFDKRRKPTAFLCAPHGEIDFSGGSRISTFTDNSELELILSILVAAHDQAP